MPRSARRNGCQFPFSVHAYFLYFIYFTSIPLFFLFHHVFINFSSTPIEVGSKNDGSDGTVSMDIRNWDGWHWTSIVIVVVLSVGGLGGAVITSLLDPGDPWIPPRTEKQNQVGPTIDDGMKQSPGTQPTSPPVSKSAFKKLCYRKRNQVGPEIPHVDERGPIKYCSICCSDVYVPNLHSDSILLSA
jgi:hypothetical protein